GGCAHRPAVTEIVVGQPDLGHALVDRGAARTQAQVAPVRVDEQLRDRDRGRGLAPVRPGARDRDRAPVLAGALAPAVHGQRAVAVAGGEALDDRVAVAGEAAQAGLVDVDGA